MIGCVRQIAGLTVRAHFCEVDGRVWGACSLGVLVQVLRGGAALGAV